ncbi:hypothetical protein ACF053_27395 [Streptomyces kanasensis]|uniref:hypothetical protein n=1 Tax=Streptomyces kanasensis TaxID=936756 RepID=UPI003702C5BB
MGIRRVLVAACTITAAAASLLLAGSTAHAGQSPESAATGTARSSDPTWDSEPQRALLDPIWD